MQVSTEVPDVMVELRVMLALLRLQARLPFWESVTVPVNPTSAVTVIVELPGDPAGTITVDGLAAIAKSCTVTLKVAECCSEPLVPVTVTV